MQDDREAGQFFFYFGQYVEGEGRRNQHSVRIFFALFGFELLTAVAGADGNRQGVYSGSLYKILHFFGLRIVAFFGRNIVFNAGQNAQLAFNRNIVFLLVRVIAYFFCQFYVFFIGQRRTVDHNGRKSHLNAGFAQFKRIAVVQVQRNLRFFAAQFFCICNGSLCHVAQQRLVCVFACTGRNLQNNRRVRFHARLNNRLKLFHVIEVVRGDRIAAFDGFGEHFFRIHQT